MRTIFAMGGGGFAMEPENPLLDNFILSLSDKPRPKVCFIPTASGDADSYKEKFTNAYGALPCEPTILSLFKPPTRDLEKFVCEQDIIHVGGGSTKNLICLWKEWGLDKAIKKAYERGVILTGISAGMICWFEEGVTDSYGDGLEPLECLGILEGSACPHFDGESDRRPTYIKLIKEMRISGGLALEDGVGALFRDEEFVGCYSSRPNGRAYVFESETAVETRLPVQFLGQK